MEPFIDAFSGSDFVNYRRVLQFYRLPMKTLLFIGFRSSHRGSLFSIFILSILISCLKNLRDFQTVRTIFSRGRTGERKNCTDSYDLGWDEETHMHGGGPLDFDRQLLSLWAASKTLSGDRFSSKIVAARKAFPRLLNYGSNTINYSLCWLRPLRGR